MFFSKISWTQKKGYQYLRFDVRCYPNLSKSQSVSTYLAFTFHFLQIGCVKDQRNQINFCPTSVMWGRSTLFGKRRAIRRGEFDIIALLLRCTKDKGLCEGEMKRTGLLVIVFPLIIGAFVIVFSYWFPPLSAPAVHTEKVNWSLFSGSSCDAEQKPCCFANERRETDEVITLRLRDAGQLNRNHMAGEIEQ